MVGWVGVLRKRIKVAKNSSDPRVKIGSSVSGTRRTGSGLKSSMAYR